MAKYTSEEVKRIAGRLRMAKERSRPAHFLIGAGCSLTAKIPSAPQIVKIIHDKYKDECKGLTDSDRSSYGACMALLSINERRDLIKPLLEDAKVNWGHIALAQMIGSGFVGRILSVNFDLVPEHACGLLGLQPAVYDFGIAPASDAALIVSPAICHLHGQSYGLVLLNTEKETREHRDKLRPVLTDSLRNAPLVVIGYSGSADGVFQTLIDDFEGRESLYWIGHSPDPAPHIRPLFDKPHAQFLGEADFDRFMIDLAQTLGCWPPRLFTDPLAQLRHELTPLVPYPVGDADSEIDILSDLRSKLVNWRKSFGESEKKKFAPVRSAFMKGDFAAADRAVSALTAAERAGLSRAERDIAFWSLVSRGSSLRQEAERANGKEAARLFDEGNRKYQQALAIKPDSHEALYSWGTLLLAQAKCAGGEAAARLFGEAGEKYRQALAIKPDSHEALYSWGSLLLEQAKRASGEEAARLFGEAGEKYRQALAVKPDSHEALYGSGVLLVEQAKRTSGDEAARLLDEGAERYERALAIKPDGHEALYGLGNLLSLQAQRATGDEAARLFDEAERRLLSAAALEPGKTYNLACLAALRGQNDMCRDYLNQAKAHGTLPGKGHMRTDTDFDSVRNEPWFQDLLASLDG